MSTPSVKFDKQTDGYVLLDWVRGHNAVIRPDCSQWLVVCRETGVTLGEGRKPADAIISAANNARTA